MSDFGISLQAGGSNYNTMASLSDSYENVHYCGKPIYQTEAFDELKDSGKTERVRYTSKFDVCFYGIILWKILTR